MNNGMRVLSYDSTQGIREYSTYSANQSYAIAMGIGFANHPNKTFFLNTYRIRQVATADALNAFSFNNTTGAAWCSNVQILSWDASRYKAYWSFDATKNIYTANSVIRYWRAPYYYLDLTVLNYTFPTWGEDANPGRTLINALTAAEGVALNVLFCEK